MTPEDFIAKNILAKIPDIEQGAIDAALMQYRQCRNMTGKVFDELLYIARQHHLKNKRK